jgi:hypothetical protein
MHPARFRPPLLIAVMSWCVVAAQNAPGSGALTYSLQAGHESWPADRRAAIVQAMDAAVGFYNANGYFPRALTVNYNRGVPTAHANINGSIEFGGSINTRVALHEIGHTLGVGTHSAWKSNLRDGIWTGPCASNLVQQIAGTHAVLRGDRMHFWPFGLNFDREDGPASRTNHVRLVAALRRDLGIVQDTDADGLPDDWEMFEFGSLLESSSGDSDGDGVNNLAEYRAATPAGVRPTPAAAQAFAPRAPAAPVAAPGP